MRTLPCPFALAAALVLCACGGPSATVGNNITVTQQPYAPPPSPTYHLTQRWQEWRRTSDNCNRVPLSDTQEDVPCGKNGCPIRVSKQRFRNGSKTENLQITLSIRSEHTDSEWENHIRHSKPPKVCRKIEEAHVDNPTSTGDLGVCEVHEE